MTRLWRAALKAQSKTDAESDAESEPECQVVEEHAQRGPDAQAETDAQGEEGALGVLLFLPFEGFLLQLFHISFFSIAVAVIVMGIPNSPRQS